MDIDSVREIPKKETNDPQENQPHENTVIPYEGESSSEEVEVADTSDGVDLQDKKLPMPETASKDPLRSKSMERSSSRSSSVDIPLKQTKKTSDFTNLYNPKPKIANFKQMLEANPHNHPLPLSLLTDKTSLPEAFSLFSMSVDALKLPKLNNPISLQVGQFDNVLQDLRPKAEALIGPRRFVRIKLKDAIKGIERGTNNQARLDNLWAAFGGPIRINLVENMIKVFTENERPTVMIIVERKQFRCHALVLQVISKFFRDCMMEKSHIYHLPSSMVTARSFVALYRWALEPIHCMTTTYLLQVLRTAQFFDCPEIVSNCWLAIEESAPNPECTVSLYQRAQEMKLNLEDHLLGKFSMVFLQFVASQEFRQLNVSQLKRLLDLNTLWVNSEMEVYFAAAYWLSIEWPSRRRFAEKLVDSIQFDQMPILFLSSIIRATEGPPVLAYLAHLTELTAAVRKAMDGVNVAANKFQGRGKENARHWIYDQRADHHHVATCSRAQFVNWEEFANYMKWLQSAGPKHWRTMVPIYETRVRCCPPAED